MRQISRPQFYALWFCVGYFAIVIALLRDTPKWAFTWPSSSFRQELPAFRDGAVLREVQLLFDMLARSLQLHTVLLAAGAAMLLATVIWITRSRAT